MSQLQKFDKYLHELEIEHTHEFIADGELIIRKRRPEQESPEIQQREKGFQKFKKFSNPAERCIMDEDVY